MKQIKIVTLVGFLAILTGCATKDEEVISQEATQGWEGKNVLPEWMLTPPAGDGVYATDCLPFSGNLSIDQKAVTANARQNLASTLSEKVTNIIHTDVNRTDVTKGLNYGATFAQTSTQVSEVALANVRIKQYAQAVVKGVDNYCVLVHMEADELDAIFEDSLEQALPTLGAADKNILFQEFKSWRQRERLTNSLDN